MPVIALQGLRGGMGATSVTAALAWALQQLGESVLAIDFAPDNQLRLHFNTPFELARGWARAEQDGGEWQQGAMHYCENLDFLPFGRLTAAERLNLQQYCRQHPTRWQENLAQLSASAQYNWILLDLPADDPLLAAQALPLADCVFMLITPDANCQVRLHQQALPEGCRFLINHYFAASQLQQDLHQLWLQTLGGLLPVAIHRDEAMAEALAVKQPLGEYRPESLAADEVMTLANWCLINLKETAP
ncbi:cellulose biosynthesis protein BcsQ [Serratia quinivorans]|uniref:cellulose biosynthesis protein BcsQ n=1 Tax=Serratia quinivorans TaxID=137545 RepID=UPI00217B6630|nr:cellulose biosynthesis protein BcsQ [Serratia quinivorans]CAI1113191.1 cell division protein [Serratia quinivorans]CAI1161307.1 cell division protein [Serratia quinivorans]CAI1822639.1 cell division protein [Serratia quinivorans]CAI2142032.1 cell division protein [Serratia quinivorans]CAI2148176.1 cell division protein [Serratia quinivorans]